MDKNWSDQYWEYMMAENFEEAIPLKLDNFPRSLFKYRSLNDRTLDAIENNYLWVAEISSLNDPFECSIQFDNDQCLREFYSSPLFHKNFRKITGYHLEPEQIQVLTNSEKPFLEYVKICKDKNIPFTQTPEEQLTKVQKRWAEIVEETNRNLRICSFSKNNDSLLLWSHYAEEHKGISIEYDFLDNDYIRGFLQPIIYRNQIPKIGIFEEYSIMQMIGSSLIKSKDWEYENEWRLIVFKQGDNFPEKISCPKPVAIHLGTRFQFNKEELKERLFRIASEKQISIYQMTKSSTEFKLISI